MKTQNTTNASLGTQIDINRLLQLIGAKEVELTLYKDKVNELAIQLSTALEQLKQVNDKHA